MALVYEAKLQQPLYVAKRRLYVSFIHDQQSNRSCIYLSKKHIIYVIACTKKT